MFFSICQDAGTLPSCCGPFDEFSQASAAAEHSAFPLVVQFSLVYGWLSIWERRGNRWELVKESPDAYAMRERRQ